MRRGRLQNASTDQPVRPSAFVTHLSYVPNLKYVLLAQLGLAEALTREHHTRLKAGTQNADGVSMEGAYVDGASDSADLHVLSGYRPDLIQLEVGAS